MDDLMFGPTTEIVDSSGQRIAITHLVKGRSILSRRNGRLCRGEVAKVGVSVDGLAVTLLTACGRRVTVAGGQRVFGRGKAGKPCWRPAKELRVGSLVYALADGILSLDRLTCVVQAERPGECWTTVVSTQGNVFAEEILCRAS